MKNDILKHVKEKAQFWLDEKFDAETRKKVQDMLQNDEDELIESFYKDLEFGTGGLRGIMGVGTNRMNIYTVGMATQGLCNYLKCNFSELEQIKVAIAHDSRNNGPLFAKTAANVFSANGIKVYLFDELRPTPELSFAIRHLGCQSGVVITASHNPKEYNGYKAYWDDGGQIIAPHDVNIVNEVKKIQSIDEVKFDGSDHNIKIIGKEIDEAYLKQVETLSLSPDAITKQKDIKIVYTPIHGTGVKLVPLALQRFGFTNIYHVEQQDVPDGNFPTVVSPNPENAEALQMAIDKAKAIDAELVMASDPDADRVGIAIKNKEGEYRLLNGNQTGSLLVYYLLYKWNENKKLTGNEFIVKTVVTTDLIKDIAEKYKVDCYEVLTGFKYIADIIKSKEDEMTFIGGGEESYGYLAGDFVRDKDAVISCALIAEALAWAKTQGKSFIDLLADIYAEFGFYKEHLINVVKKGKAGAEEIQNMMADYRKNPPKTINASRVTIMKDYQEQLVHCYKTGTKTEIHLPKSNVLQFSLEDGSKVSVRPSGTEPKIKFYFSVKTKLTTKDDFDKTEAMLDERIKAIINDMQLA